VDELPVAVWVGVVAFVVVQSVADEHNRPAPMSCTAIIGLGAEREHRRADTGVSDGGVAAGADTRGAGGVGGAAADGSDGAAGDGVDGVDTDGVPAGADADASESNPITRKTSSPENFVPREPTVIDFLAQCPVVANTNVAEVSVSG
jgi:hypothetical protein